MPFPPNINPQQFLFLAWLFELAEGAVADAEDNCLPKSQREAAFTVAALHQWDLDNHDDRCITAAETWISSTLLPVSTGGPFPTVSKNSASRIFFFED